MSTLDKYRGLGRVPELAAKLEGHITYKFYESTEEIEYTPEPKTCHVIVTCRSMLWTLLTFCTTFMIIVSVITPQWLVGKPRWIGLRPARLNGSIYQYEEHTYKPTLGIFNRCTKVHRFGFSPQDHCATYVTGLDMPNGDFPNFWKSAMLVFTIGMGLLGVSVLMAVLSLCKQDVCRKSIFTVTGLIQSIAGLFLVVGMVLYPAGWSAQRVKNLCGDRSQPFLMDQCSLGWAFYTMVLGILGVFISALLSIKAEEATSSDKVESKVLDGKHIICLM